MRLDPESQHLGGGCFLPAFHPQRPTLCPDILLCDGHRAGIRHLLYENGFEIVFWYLIAAFEAAVFRRSGPFLFKAAGLGDFAKLQVSHWVIAKGSLLFKER